MPGMRLELRQIQRLELTQVQKDLGERAKKAGRRMNIPLERSTGIAAFRDQLAVRMTDVGSTLLGVPLSPEVFKMEHFREMTKIFLTLQASWSKENDKGMELLKLGFSHLVEKGSIKSLKYGGTEETAVQLRVAEALIDRIYPGLGKVYMEAWAADMETESFWTTDGFYDWLTMGKVCGGSCQSYDGAPYYNKSLGGPMLSLDKLAFTGKNKVKRCRTLFVPTPVKVEDRLEWDIIVPRVYTENEKGKAEDIRIFMEAALRAAAISGAERVGILFNVFDGKSVSEIFEEIRDEKMLVEIRDREGTVVRKEVIIPKSIEQKSCIIYAMQNPNRYKYWDNAGGIIDSKEAKKMKLKGIKVKINKLETDANFISFERIPV